MQVAIAYIGVILIWSTTPLGIKWSGEGGITFLFGVTSRMTLACVLAIALVWVLKIPYSLRPKAILAYAISGLSIYGSMSLAYWGATFIPSGWLSVVWGTSPVITGILAHKWLGEKISINGSLGILMSVSGLFVIFSHSDTLDYDKHTWWGGGLVLGGAFVQSSAVVLLKKINNQEHSFMMTTAGLLLSLPLFALTWYVFDGVIPKEVSIQAGLSILYLATFGSLMGFSFYYFLVKNIQASRLSLVTLITPVLALFMGNLLNNEALTPALYLGTGLILLGLVSFLFWGTAGKASSK